MRSTLRSYLAGAACAVLGSFILVVILADFIAPYDHTSQIRQSPSAPPTTLRFQHSDGTIHLRPFIYRSVMVDPLNRRYEEDPSTMYPVELLVSGEPYLMWGIFPSRTRLFGVVDPSIRVNLLGTDELGRDRLSRLIQAMRFSLLVCPVGAILAWLIGLAIGLMSGYAADWLDTGLMGIADAMLALPALILILAARAAFPLELPPLQAATLLITIFAATGWAEIARLTRGLVRSIQNREFVLAARAIGLSDLRILTRHILPNALPTIARQGLLILPYFLLAEVALSFLGVGLQDPAPSLGNLLAAASDINRLRSDPFLVLAPGFVSAVFVLAIRLVGGQADRGHKVTF